MPACRSDTSLNIDPKTCFGVFFFGCCVAECAAEAVADDDDDAKGKDACCELPDCTVSDSVISVAPAILSLLHSGSTNRMLLISSILDPEDLYPSPV